MLARKSKSIARYHVIPQVDYLVNTKGFITMILLRFENLGVDLERCFGIKVPFDTNRKRSTLQYSKAEKDLIQKLYAQDFKVLGYPE